MRVCLNCGQNLGLLERITGDYAIETKDGREICPACYSKMDLKKRSQWFD